MEREEEGERGNVICNEISPVEYRDEIGFPGTFSGKCPNVSTTWTEIRKKVWLRPSKIIQRCQTLGLDLPALWTFFTL
jgi:hypothetical protein